MRPKIKNAETISGKLYEHALALKTVERADSPNKGTQYISGTISVATDPDNLNIVDIHYSYVTAMTKAGKTNATFTALKKIIDEGKTVLLDGPEHATMVSCTPSLAVNDFYTTRNGEEQLVSAKRNEGGFCSIVNSLPNGGEAKFEIDFFITGVTRVEADEERGIDKDYLTVKGFVFDFRNAIFPVDMTVKREDAFNYFESLEAAPKNPTFVKVYGNIESQSIVRRVEEESAFGEPIVKEFSRTVRQWVINNVAKEKYELTAEEGISGEEFKKAQEDRNIYLADVKKRQDEYQASKGTATAAAPVTAANGAFDF